VNVRLARDEQCTSRAAQLRRTRHACLTFERVCGLWRRTIGPHTACDISRLCLPGTPTAGRVVRLTCRLPLFAYSVPRSATTPAVTNTLSAAWRLAYQRRDIVCRPVLVRAVSLRSRQFQVSGKTQPSSDDFVERLKKVRERLSLRNATHSTYLHLCLLPSTYLPLPSTLLTPARNVSATNNVTARNSIMASRITYINAGGRACIFVRRSNLAASRATLRQLSSPTINATELNILYCRNNNIDNNAITRL